MPPTNHIKLYTGITLLYILATKLQSTSPKRNKCHYGKLISKTQKDGHRL